MAGCLGHRIRQLILEGSGLKLRDSLASSKMDVHCFLFTDTLLICKSTSRKGDKVRVIRQPFLVDRVVTHELRDGSGFIVIYLNELHVASAFLILYTPETRTWLECIRQAQEIYREAKQQSALISAQSSFIYRTMDGDDEEAINAAILHASGVHTGSGLLLASPRNSSLVHSGSGSGSVDTSDPASFSQLGSQMIAPATTPNYLLSSNYGTESCEILPSRATSFELGDLRNPSMTLDDLDAFGRSRSMETRTPSVTITSPRPERRAFLLRGAGGERNSCESFTYSNNNVNTLSVHVPSLHVSNHVHHSLQQQQQQHQPTPSSSSTQVATSSRALSSSNHHHQHHQHHETCIQVPVINQAKPPHSQSNSSKSIPNKKSNTSSCSKQQQRPISPRSLQRSLPVIEAANKPPLIKMKNITGLRVHSAPASEDPSPVHSFDSEQGSCDLSVNLGGSDVSIKYPLINQWARLIIDLIVFLRSLYFCCCCIYMTEHY